MITVNDACWILYLFFYKGGWGKDGLHESETMDENENFICKETSLSFSYMEIRFSIEISSGYNRKISKGDMNDYCMHMQFTSFWNKKIE